MYGLAEAGKTDEQGRPNLLHMAVIGRKHLDDFRACAADLRRAEGPVIGYALTP